MCVYLHMFQTPCAAVAAPGPAPFLLESVTVEGLGRFMALSSGLVRVTFTDRTCVELWGDVSRRLERCQGHSDGGVVGGGVSMRGHVTANDACGYLQETLLAYYRTLV